MSSRRRSAAGASLFRVVSLRIGIADTQTNVVREGWCVRGRRGRKIGLAASGRFALSPVSVDRLCFILPKEQRTTTVCWTGRTDLVGRAKRRGLGRDLVQCL